MKLVINSQRIYLHKNDSKRKKNKRRVKSFTEWRQDTESPFQVDSDEAVHEECMKLIGLPTVLDEVDVQPILGGGGLFTEVLAFGSPPLINAARQRNRRPPEQGNQDGIVNGENSHAHDSSDFCSECESEGSQKNDVQDDNDKTPIDHGATSSNEPNNTSVNNTSDKNDLHDDDDEEFINFESFDEEITAHEDASQAIDNDYDNSTQNKDKENKTNDRTMTIKEDVNTDNNHTTQNKDGETTTNDCKITIKQEINDEEMPFNDDIAPIADNSKELLNNTLNKNNLLDNGGNANNETAVDIKIDDSSANEAKDLLDIEHNDTSIILNNNNIDLSKDDSMIGNDKSKDATIIKEGNNIDNDKESNLTNNDLKEAILDDTVKDSSPINITVKNNELGDDETSPINKINPENTTDNAELLDSTVERELLNEDFSNIETNNAKSNGQSDLIDLTHLGEIQPNKIPNNTLIDLTFCDKDWGTVDTKIEGNEHIDLTFSENKDESAQTLKENTESKVSDTMKGDKSEMDDNEDDILMDILNYDLNSEPFIGMNVTIQDDVLDQKADVKIKVEGFDSKRGIKMEIEPQPSTSEVDTSFMKLIMNRRGRKRRADGEEVDEDDTQARQNKAKARMDYISMADLMAKDADDEDDDDEMSIAQTYADYKPRKLSFGCKHPDPVVETASLSSVEPADVTYQLSVPDVTITNGLLSAVQLEAVVYASQAHEKLLPDGTRAGFLIGDGAGVGKGRTVAGITFDNYLKGRKRALWFSVSRDLKYDAERDLRDIGAEFISAHNIVDMKYNDDISSSTNGDVDEGVIFSTYSSLVSKNNSGCKYSSRLEQLLQWCGPEFDGVIIFDECHKAKNLHTTQTQTGQNVLELQNRLPKARVVYASATGASEPHNMAYMVRLGIWGEGTPFKNFADFNKAVEKRGVSAMELVAMDLKQRGVYIARQLSFQGVCVHIKHVPMSTALKAVYDDSTKLWSKARIKFEEAVAKNSALISQTQRRTIWSQFWGNHQRFFKYLCIAAKVEAAVKEALDAVNNGKCAVIGLQGTGEARTLDIIKNSETELTDFISTSEGVFQNLVEKQFPTEDYCMKVKRRKLSPNSSHSHLSYTESMQVELLSDIKKLGPRLPKNTLDELVHKLGGPSKVAEMTGRIGRLLHKNGSTVYESRAWGLIKQENVNMAEKQLFMDGKKDIGIISEAASSGISLQSDRRALNKKRRVHITLELPWSADQAVQQFGRTHRSNQVNAPEYIFLISDLAGERRFASTVAKRLESLGALTHGDRRATDTRDLSQFNIDNKYGRLALSKMMQALSGLDPEALVPPPADHPNFIQDVTNALRDVQFFEQRSVQKYDTATFLNRILGIPVDLQNLLFKYYTDTLAGVIELAKRNNKFDMGILELGSSGRVTHVASRSFTRQHATGTATLVLHSIMAERGMDWASAEQAALSKSGHERTFYRPRPGVKNKHIIMCISVFPNVKNSLVWVYSPNSGQAKETQLVEDIKKNYSKVSKLETARVEWDKQYRHALKACRHEQCRGQTVCQTSRSVRPYHILSGSLLAVWTLVEDVLLAGRGRQNAVMRIIRADTDNGLKIIGILIPKKYVARLQEELSKDPNEKKDIKPAIENKPLPKPGPSVPLHAKENISNNVMRLAMRKEFGLAVPGHSGALIPPWF